MINPFFLGGTLLSELTMTWNLRYKCCSSFDDKVIDIHRDRRWGSHSARESDLNKIQPQPSCNFTVGNWPNDGCLQS